MIGAAGSPAAVSTLLISPIVAGLGELEPVGIGGGMTSPGGGEAEGECACWTAV